MLKIMLANIIPNQLRKLVLLSAGMLALFALTACAGNDTAVDVQPTQIPTLTIAPVSDVATPVVIAQQPSVTPTVVPVPTTTATPQPSATPLVVTESASPEEIKIIDTHVGPNSGAVWDGEAAWIVGNDYGDGVRLSPTGEFLLKQNMGRIPTGLATDGESVFVSDIDGGRVVRYGLDGIELSRFNIVSPTWIKFADDGLWITALSKLNRYTTGGELIFKMDSPVEFATGAGRLFVLEGTVLDIYAVDGSVISTVTLTRDSSDVQFFDDSIWMFSENNTQLTKYDTGGVELETWTDIMGSGAMRYENGNIWTSVVKTESRSGGTIDLIRMDLETGVTQLILSGVDNGAGAVGDDHYFHGTGSIVGRIFIIDLDIEGEIVVEPLQD